MKIVGKGIAVFLLLVVCLPLLCCSPAGKNGCQRYNDFLGDQFAGVIVSKYIDSGRQHDPFIVLENFPGEYMSYNMACDTGDVFASLLVSDTITKWLHTDVIWVKRGEDVFPYYIDCGCEDTVAAKAGYKTRLKERIRTQ
jgi:hypothetical protein